MGGIFAKRKKCCNKCSTSQSSSFPSKLQSQLGLQDSCPQFPEAGGYIVIPFAQHIDPSPRWSLSLHCKLVLFGFCFLTVVLGLLHCPCTYLWFLIRAVTSLVHTCSQHSNPLVAPWFFDHPGLVSGIPWPSLSRPQPLHILSKPSMMLSHTLGSVISFYSILH